MAPGEPRDDAETPAAVQQRPKLVRDGSSGESGGDEVELVAGVRDFEDQREPSWAMIRSSQGPGAWMVVFVVASETTTARTSSRPGSLMCSASWSSTV